MTYVAKEKFGLRPLMFHCDAGWNSDLGVSNIQKIIEGLDLDLVTEVVNWEEMKDLQRAFFKSQVPFVDTPQDLALFSAIYNFAAKNGFKYVICDLRDTHFNLLFNSFIYHFSDIDHLDIIARRLDGL